MSTAAEIASRGGAVDLRGGTIPFFEPQVGPSRECQFSVPTFYINRDCDEDRRAAIELELRTAGIAAERIRAVEGLAVPEDLRAYFFDAERLSSALKPGEVGCYASHLKALKTMIERGLEYALILEDDAVLPRDLRRVIDDVLACLPHSWDLVHLCGDPRRAVKPVRRLKHRGTLVRYSRVPSGTVGYLISRGGARKFLAPIKRSWPVDTDFRRPWLFGLETYGVAPKIIDHSDSLPSPIQSMGGRARARRGLPRPSFHSWTGNPLHCPEGVYYNFRALGPLSWARCSLENAYARAAGMLGLKRLVGQP
ncbi:MAG: glycosyltransferase family 25 protein [Hyphomicrobium sp.]|nr:glycosyltransferase family 25 protein [Hyphomicrobium sp.]